MAEGTGIGALAVRIVADVSDFMQVMGRVDSELERVGRKVDKHTKEWLKFGAAAATASAGVYAFAKQSAEVVDEIGKMAQKVGVSVEAMSALKYAAQLSDVSLEGLGTGLKQLSKNMAEAQAGTDEAADAFKALKLGVTDSTGKLKPTEEMLLALADKFAGMEDGANKTALAMKIFGKSGADLIPFLNQGRDGIEQLRKEAERLGVVFSAEAAKKAEEFNDNITRLKTAATGLAVEFSGPVVEAMNKAAQAMLNAKNRGEELRTTFLEGFRTLFTGDDAHKWNVEFTGATERLLAAQNNVDRLRNLGGWAAARGLENARKELEAAKKDVDRLLAIKPVLAPDAPSAAGGEKPKGAAPALPNQEAKRAEEQRQKEIIDATKKAGEERDKIELDQIARRNEINEKAENTALESRFKLIEERTEREYQEGQARLERIRQLKEFEFKTDEQLEMEAHKARMARLDGFTEEELNKMGGKQKIAERLTADHQDRLTEIQRRGIRTTADFEKATNLQRSRFMAGFMADMTAGVAQSSRRMFELNKLAGIANVALSLPEKISDAWKWGNKFGGPVMGAAFASVAAAAGMAHLAMIKSQTFNGGGGSSAPSIAGSTPAAPVSPVSSGDAREPDRTTVIHLPNQEFVSTKLVRALLEKMGEDGMKRGRIVIA